MDAAAPPSPETLPARWISVPVTRYVQKCSLIWCVESRRAAVIDPGGDIDLILDVIRAEGVTVDHILLTHAHLDHAAGAGELSVRLKRPVTGPHRAEAPLFAGKNYPPPDQWLEDGDTIAIGAQTLSAIHVPGHTPGHMAYFQEASRIAFVGDILFRGAVGHTSGPVNHIILLRSILTKLWPLGKDVAFVPGHGPNSTFGIERFSSPALGDAHLAPYRHKILAFDRSFDDGESRPGR